MTKRWRPHQHTQRRANDLGVDLRRWPLEQPHPGWHDAAACRRAPSEVANAMGDLLSQAQATELVEHWCQKCPVRQACFETGRALKGHGLWGAIVLREGKVATWRTAAERSRTSPSEIPQVADDDTAPAENTVQISDAVAGTIELEAENAVQIEPPKRRRGQRSQPRRLTRARRRGRHAPVA